MDNNEMEMEYQIAFELVGAAGDSKVESMMAIDCAAQNQFEEAEKHLKAADEKMVAAHEIQTEMLQKEACGQKINMNIFLVHAQDHLTTAIIMRDQAEIIMHLYSKIKELSK